VKSIGDYAFDYTGIANVYYAGAEAQWNAITIGEGNDDLLAATMHYNYTAPQAEPQPTPQPPVTPAPVKVQFAKQAAYAEGQYSDVPAGKWYARSVASAYELGLMKGNADGSFNPNGNVTLAEAVTMAARIHSLYTTGAESFPKGEGKWYQPYLDYAREKGIISEETFSSDANRALTRAQFAQILAAALPAEALPAVNTVALGAIPDVKGDSPAFDAIYTLYRAGILIGNDKAGTFKPDSALTRAETAAIVTRMADSDSRLSITLY
ncbi:MAG: S-layer homology domain-containing protein, partial [bacterium]